jgi:hypothetical protein
MRQIHAAIKHLDRGDFECANNAGRRRRRNVASQGQAPFRKLQGVMKVDDIVSWLRHGESKHKDNSKNKFRETTTISEFEVLVV